MNTTHHASVRASTATRTLAASPHPSAIPGGYRRPFDPAQLDSYINGSPLAHTCTQHTHESHQEKKNRGRREEKINTMGKRKNTDTTLGLWEGAMIFFFFTLVIMRAHARAL